MRFHPFRVMHPRRLLPALTAAALTVGLYLTAWPGTAAAQNTVSTVAGRAVSSGPDGEPFAVARAKMEIILASGEPMDVEIPPVKSDDRGIFRFTGVPEGCYVVTGESAATRGQSGLFCVPSQEPLQVTVTMELEVVVETIDVTATMIEIDPTQTSSAGSVGNTTIEEAPKRNRTVEDVMPLIPGVLRGPSGEINMSGARASQGSTRFNSAKVTDPVTGISEIDMPFAAVSNVEVLSSPYDAQYGGFAGAVSTVDTKASNLIKTDLGFQNFLPRFRERGGTIVGVESYTPMLTVTGPIKKGKYGFLHSTQYQFVRDEQEFAKFGNLERDTSREALSVFTQFDAQLTERNKVITNVLVYPEKLSFFDLNTFTQQSATPNLRRRGLLLTLRDTHNFSSGATLLSHLALQDLDGNVRANSLDPYELPLERARGGFFNKQSRETTRQYWSELLNLQPVQGLGEHQFKTGFELALEDYEGLHTFDQVSWLGLEERLVRQMTFGAPAGVSADKNEFGLFLQDKWSAAPGLTLDLGLRLERDSIADEMNPSYRTGFAYAIGEGNKMAVRGGVGVFYNRITLVTPTFLDLPRRTDTSFGPGGEIASQLFFDHRLDGRIRNPRSLGWSFQLDRKVGENLFLRGSYQQRRTKRNLLVEPQFGVLSPESSTPRNYLTLSNRGRDSYREWQLTGRYRLPKGGHVTASYTRSSSVGDLNDLSTVYGRTALDLIQPNERAPLEFDVPNRFLFWSQFDIPWGLRAVPVLEIRDGFPYSIVNEHRNIVGARNRAGRFPVWKTLDFQMTKLVTISIRGKKTKVRAGVRIFNLLGSYNPRDIQNNLASPFFGTFFRSVPRKFRATFEVGN